MNQTFLGRLKQWGLYNFMVIFLVIEAMYLIHEKMTVSDSVLLGNYMLLEQEGDTPLEFVYQFPSLSNLDASIGVLFLAHGCSHSATDFWPKFDLGCPKCRGLPVEKAIVVEALTREYIVIAATAQDTSTGCWGSADLPRAVRAINFVRKQINLPEEVPNFLLGASSGGAFVGALAVHMNEQAQELKQPYMRVSGVNIQISPLQRQYWKRQLFDQKLLPSIHFVHMSRDKRTTTIIEDFLEIANKIDNAIVVEDAVSEGTNASNEGEKESVWFQIYSRNLEAKHLQGSQSSSPVVILRSVAKPRPLSVELLVDRAYSVVPSYSVANTLLKAFITDGVTDQEGMLLQDPRSNAINWRDTVYRVIPDVLKSSGDSLIPDQSAISEIMNVAYAQHEFTDEFIQTTFDFFDQISPFNDENEKK